jgi:hypothetical protein
MRELADAAHIEEFMRALGRAAKAEGRVYLTGGATAVLIPVPDGWEERSPFIRREGTLSFHHFDPVAQALSKAERGHAQDLLDVREMIACGKWGGLDSNQRPRDYESRALTN